MNIIFKTIKTKNFMSFKELEFSFDKFQGQNVLIYGSNEDIKGDTTCSNGSGKSTIMNTLMFSLYGDILNSAKMSHIRNWTCSPKEDVEVSLTLQSNGVDYAIQRILHGKKGEQELHVFKKQSVEQSEWEEITLSTIAETQRMIENDIVLCGKDGFLRCVLLTADQNYNFFKLNKAAKNQFFESLFELTVYSDMYNRLHRKTLDETASLTASSRTIDSLNANILKLEQDREYEKEHQESLKAAKAELVHAKDELFKFTEKNDVKAEVSKIDDEISNCKRQFGDKMSKAMRKYDSEHGISEVDSQGNIVFDVDSEQTVVEKAVAEFDIAHDIKLDDDGNIIFDENAEYNKIVEKGNEVKNRITKGKELVSKIEANIRAFENNVRSLQNDVACGEQRIKSMKLTLKTHSKITDLLCEDCLGKYKKSVNIQDMDSDIAEIEKNISEYLLQIEDNKSKIDNERPFLTKYNDGIEKLSKSLAELREKASEIIAARKSLQTEREMCRRNAENEIRMKRREMQTGRNEYKAETTTRLSAERMSTERQLEEKKNALLQKHHELEKNVADAEYRCRVLEDSVSKNFDAPIKTLKESLEAAKTDFYTQTDNLAHFKALEEILKPENIRKSVVTDMLKELNFRICGYLSKMGSNYTCRFDEDFDATFIASNGNETEYNVFSSGEKMRLGIACCLAFRDFMQVRLNLHPNILAIDEYIDSNLDPMAVKGIMDTIHYMVGTEKIAAFIISHRSEVMQDMFDSEILVRKKDNESKLVVNGMQTS